MDKEIKDLKKITVKIGDEERVVEVRKPNPKVEAEGNMAASKMFSRLVREKDESDPTKPAYILRTQLNAYLADIGIYSDQDIDDINTFGDRIKELEELLRSSGKKKSEGKAAAIELRKLRYAVYALLMRQGEFDKNTVEHYADNARMNYLITKCICFEGGGPIWHSVEDYESDSVLQSTLAEPIQVLAGMVSQYDPDFEKNLPENKFLKKYGFCDDKYRLIDKSGNFVDGNGKPVDEDGNSIEPKEKVEDVGEFLDDDEEKVEESDTPEENLSDPIPEVASDPPEEVPI